MNLRLFFDYYYISVLIVWVLLKIGEFLKGGILILKSIGILLKIK